jgi:hypothetical protein
MFLFVPLSSVGLKFSLSEVVSSFLNKFLFLVQELVIHEQTDVALGDSILEDRTLLGGREQSCPR